MDNGKKLAGSSSSSSFTNDLFGSNDSGSSSGAFGSIFAPPSNSKSTRRDGYGYGHRSEVFDSRKRDDLTGRPEKAKEGEEGGGQSNVLDSIFEGERGFVHQPCNLSSSIYYGGQDMYFTPTQTQTQTSSSYKKNGEDDDPHSASRGEWWQGSVYY